LSKKVWLNNRLHTRNLSLTSWGFFMPAFLPLRLSYRMPFRCRLVAILDAFGQWVMIGWPLAWKASEIAWNDRLRWSNATAPTTNRLNAPSLLRIGRNKRKSSEKWTPYPVFGFFTKFLQREGAGGSKFLSITDIKN
jgi:hypothetical protein